jgi:hypothetical protein
MTRQQGVGGGSWTPSLAMGLPGLGLMVGSYGMGRAGKRPVSAAAREEYLNPRVASGAVERSLRSDAAILSAHEGVLSHRSLVARLAPWTGLLGAGLVVGAFFLRPNETPQTSRGHGNSTSGGGEPVCNNAGNAPFGAPVC